MKTKSLTHEQIAERAYQIYLANGCRHGHDVDDWLQAQYELSQKPVRALAETKTGLKRLSKNAGLLAAVVQSAILISQYR